MAIRFTCPTCRTVCSVGDEHRGKTVACPSCKKALMVPGAAPPKPPAPLAPKPIPAPAASAPTRPPVPSPAPKPTVPAIVARPAAVKPAVVTPPAPTRGVAATALPLLKKALAGRGKLVALAAAGVGGLGLFTLLVGVLFLYFFWRSPSQPTAPEVALEKPPPRAEVPPGPPPAKMEADTLRKVKQATVYIRVKLPSGGVGEGTGFLCLEPGVVVTNAHVLGMLRADAQPPQTVDVVLHSGEANEVQTTGAVLAVDRTSDLAVLRVPIEADRLPPPLPVDSAETLVETQNLYVFGFPLGAELGKNITVSPSAVTSLRRDSSGVLSRVQVNGGMQPGNSGGPVTDTRGAVVGVSVAIIQGTQINFAIPGDSVVRLLDGKCTGVEPGTPYRGDGGVMLPVKVDCLDPLGRVRDLKVDVWAGSPGPNRPTGTKAPPAKSGDGPRQTYPLARADGGFRGDVPLPARQPGQVCWVQPVFLNAVGVRQWDLATSVPDDAQVVLERKPALIQFKAPTAAIERTLKVNSSVTLNVFRGQQTVGVVSQKMNGTALESLNPDALGRGTAVRLTIGNTEFTRETGGQTLVPPPQARTLLSQFSPTFLVDANHACKERGNRTFQVLPPNIRDLVERMYETVCNTFEATTLPVSGRVMQPAETWTAQMPMLVLREGKRNIHDLHLTCTYDGLRSAEGRNEASISLAGVVKGRGPGAATLGKVKGQARLDVERGFLTLVTLVVESEMADSEEGLRFLVSSESAVSRTEGNTQGIVAATANQPGLR